MKLRLSEGAAFLPDTVLEDVTAIVGRRGRGKTNTATVMVEEGHRAGMRFCFVDPVGVAWGLRSSKDGKAAGIPCVAMGGEHAMVPLESTAGAIVADFLAQPGPSVVLDFRLMRKGEMTRFMTAFLERLYFKNREPLLVVIDEADKFAPQRPFGEEARMLGAAEDLVKMGRARGLHSILITQRPATLSKNVITQAGILIAHGLPAPQDQKAIDAWIKERADEEHREEFLSTLGGLERGEAWIWAPELEVFKRVQIRERETFDSSATPKRGERRRDPKVFAEVDLERLSEEIKATVERAKADDPRELRKQLAEAKAQLAAKERVLAQVDAQTKDIEAKLDRIKTTEVPVIAKEQAQRLTTDAEKLVGMGEKLIAHGNEIIAALRAASTRGPGERAPAVGGGSGAANMKAARPSRSAPVVSAPGARGDHPPARLRILDALAFLEGIGIARAERVQLAFLADASPQSSAYLHNLGALRSAGLIDYPGGSLVQLSAGGRAIADGGAVPQTVEELHAAVQSKLPPARWRLVEALIGNYPDPLTREDLADRAQASPTSSAFLHNLGALRSLGLIDYPSQGQVVACPVLFLEGR